jgi:hypothetical protein
VNDMAAGTNQQCASRPPLAPEVQAYSHAQHPATPGSMRWEWAVGLAHMRMHTETYTHSLCVDTCTSDNNQQCRMQPSYKNALSMHLQMAHSVPLRRRLQHSQHQLIPESCSPHVAIFVADQADPVQGHIACTPVLSLSTKALSR